MPVYQCPWIILCRSLLFPCSRALRCRLITPGNVWCLSSSLQPRWRQTESWSFCQLCWCQYVYWLCLPHLSFWDESLWKWITHFRDFVTAVISRIQGWWNILKKKVIAMCLLENHEANPKINLVLFNSNPGNSRESGLWMAVLRSKGTAYRLTLKLSDFVLWRVLILCQWGVFL